MNPENPPAKQDEKTFFYDGFADRFDAEMNMYDLARRMEIVFRELLTEDLKGKALLDAGSGTGWFSREAVLRGAEVVSLDVGEKILTKVAEKCDSRRVAGDILKMPFGADCFDVAICTEVIEHTPDPAKALEELYRVLKRGGVLILTVPNRFWYFSVWIANKLKLRPYEGHENWPGWHELRKTLDDTGFQVEQMRGFHLFPFVFPFTHGFLKAADKYGEKAGPIMLNICARARKP